MSVSCWLVLQRDSANRGLGSVYTNPGLAESLWRIGFPMQVGISAHQETVRAGKAHLTCAL